MDKPLAKKTDKILFVKIESDGFGLGAQRRPIDKNDLPEALKAIRDYRAKVANGEPFEAEKWTNVLVVEKERIAGNGDYNLSRDRYKQTEALRTKFELIRVDEAIYDVKYTTKVKSSDFLEKGRFPIIDQSENFISGYWNNEEDVFKVEKPVILFGDHTRAVKYVDFDFVLGADGVKILQPIDKLDSKFFYYLVSNLNIKSLGYSRHFKELKEKLIPLPPLEVQKKIVAEIEGYQKIIDGARQVVENYKPRIQIDPKWEMATIEDLAADERNSIKAGPFGSSLKKEFYVPSGYKIYGQEQVIRGDASYGDYYISEEKYRELESCKVQTDDVLISLVGTYGKILIIPEKHEPGIINPRLLKLTLNQEKMLPSFFVHAFAQESVMSQVHAMSYGGTMDILSLKVLKSLRIPLPPLATQKAIVSQIEKEQELVNANKELIRIFEQKIKDRIAAVWGEE